MFPFVLTVTLVLLLGMGIIFSGLMSYFYSSDTQKRFTIGISGDTDDTYIHWGLAALQSMDEDRFSVEFAEMSQLQAQKALEKGEISAYVILPENFMEKAISGGIEPITYVTSAGLEGVTSLLKKEITQIVTEMVVQSQKGAYGLWDALKDQGLDQNIYDHTGNLSLKYAELIFHRDGLYSVKELGISDGLSTRDYYICAITVIVLALMGIPFAAVYIKKDYMLPRLLLSRGYTTGMQLLCEYGVYLLNMLLLTAVALAAVAGALTLSPTMKASDLPPLGSVVFRVIPVVMMLSALNMLLFTCSDNMVSGLLLHFFVAISLCYISGCIYPVYAFPKAVWPVAAVLPTGIARSFLAAGFNPGSSLEGLGGILLYTSLFYAVTLWLRGRKTVGVRG